MDAVEVGLAEAFFNFLRDSGVGLDGIIILFVLVGFFWLVIKGKLKIGANGNGKYVEQEEYREDIKEIKGDIKAMRSGVQDIDRRVAGVEAKMEQYSK